MKKISLLLSALFIALSSFGQSADGLFKTVTASGTNTYTISDPQPSSTAYDSKEKWLVTFTNASTGNVTLNRAGIGAKIVRDSEGTQLASGDILAGQRLLLSYNGTYYQVIGGTGSGSVEDGDKGDVTVSADGATWTIDAGAVTGSKIESSVALAGNPTTTTQSAGNNSTRIATTAYADALVAQTITNGVTTSAPSQDAVADALAALPVVYNVVTYGAVGDVETTTTAGITSGLAILTSSTSVFSADDAGKTIVVWGAGAASAGLYTTILTYTSGTQVTLAANASTTVSNQKAYWGTDNTTAFQNTINAAPYQGSELLIPAATAGIGYLVAGGLTIDRNMIVQGYGSEPFTWLTNLGGPGTPPFRGPTTIYSISPTLNLFTLQGNALTNNYPVVSFYDMSLVNVAGSVPTAGAAIKMTGDGMAHWTFQRMHIDRFYDNFNFSGGLFGRVRDCQITQPVRAGAYINVTTSFDLGGFYFEDCVFSGNLASNSTAKGIWWVAGGVVVIDGCNFNTLTYDLPTSNNYGLEYGYYVDASSTHSTGEHMIRDSWFDNIQKTGIYARPSTFILGRLMIVNTQVNPSGTASLEQINLNNIHYAVISNVHIGSTSVSGQVPIKAQNCDQLLLGPISYGTGYTLLNDLTGSTVLSDYSNGTTYNPASGSYPVGNYLRKDVNNSYFSHVGINTSAGSGAGVGSRWGVAVDPTSNYGSIGIIGTGFVTSGILKAKSFALEANAASSLIVSNYANDDIIFATNVRAEKMRITGTGHVTLGGNASTVGEARYLELTGNGGNYRGWKVPSSVAADIVYEIPAAPTISGHSLQSTTGGVTSWAYPTTPLSSILGATGTNTINNADFAQEWQWNTLTGTGIYFHSNSTTAAGNTQQVFRVYNEGANATSTQTTYGAVIQNGRTGTTSTNVGLFLSSAGGTNNYGLIINSGRTGMGIALPLTNLHVNESVNGANEIFVSNANTGGSAASSSRWGLSSTATNTNYLQQGILGTNWTTIGLLTARMGFSELNSTAHWVFSNFTAHDLIFATNSRAEKMRVTSTGYVSFGGNSTQAGEIRILEDTDDGSNYSSFIVGAQSGNIAYTLPTAVPTANGQVLTSTTAGAQSWSAYSILTGTGTLNFDLTAVNSQDLTITVTGAASGDAVSIAADPASVAADTTFFGWVSATNTVTVRCSRVGGGGAVDPASGTFRASVIHY